MPSKKQNNRIWSFLLPLLMVLAVMIISGALFITRTGEYINSSGAATMSGVMEQMAQVYDLQVNSVYERLGRIERTLFPGDTRSFSLDEKEEFLTGMTDNGSEKILFIK